MVEGQAQVPQSLRLAAVNPQQCSIAIVIDFMNPATPR
jgi:hypothetical protein